LVRNRKCLLALIISTNGVLW